MTKMNEMSIQDLVAAAKTGNDKARRVAWARVIEGREVLVKPEFKTMRQIGGKAWVANLKATVDSATAELKAI